MTFVFQRLPYDIFREIMLYTYVYTLELSCEEPELDLQVPLALPPVPASQVCRAWRRSLLSDPTMWRCLVIHEMSNNWIMELLRRSDTALLNVFLDLDLDEDIGISTSYDETQKMLSSLFQQTHRFRILRVRIDYEGPLASDPPNMQEALVKQILSYLQKPAPKLEVLSLWLQFDYYSNPEFLHEGTLFSADAPNLKQIHHRPSATFHEFDFPVLHHLSEIYLSPSSFLDMEFDRFLDLLDLSPSLKLLHVSVDWGSDSNLIWSDHREVGLPRLKSLFLGVGQMRDLADSFFQAVDLPRKLEWHIDSMDFLDPEKSPFLLHFLSEEDLPFLQIAVPEKSIELFSKEFHEPVGNYYNRFNTNTFASVHEEAETLLDLWEPLEHAIELTGRITHMVLEGVSDCPAIFNILKSTPNLNYLVIAQSGHPLASSSRTNGVCISLLSTLIPLTKEILEYIPASCSEDIPIYNSILFPHCPLLRKIALELLDPLDVISARIVRECSGLRQKADNYGCPLKIHVRCPSIDEEAECLPKGDDVIEVTILPVKSKEEYSWTQGC